MRTKNISKNLLTAAIGAIVATSAVAGSAMAAIDVTSVSTAMGDAGTAVGTIGAGSLVVSVGVKVWKWVARAL